MSGFGSKESKESFKQSEPSEFKNISAPMDVSGGISLKERQIEEWIDKQSDATKLKKELNMQKKYLVAARKCLKRGDISIKNKKLIGLQIKGLEKAIEDLYKAYFRERGRCRRFYDYSLKTEGLLHEYIVGTQSVEEYDYSNYIIFGEEIFRDKPVKVIQSRKFQSDIGKKLIKKSGLKHPGYEYEIDEVELDEVKERHEKKRSMPDLDGDLDVDKIELEEVRPVGPRLRDHNRNVRVEEDVFLFPDVANESLLSSEKTRILKPTDIPSHRQLLEHSHTFCVCRGPVDEPLISTLLKDKRKDLDWKRRTVVAKALFDYIGRQPSNNSKHIIVIAYSGGKVCTANIYHEESGKLELGPNARISV